MSISDEYKLLSNLPLFEYLDPSELKRLILVSERYSLSPGEYLFLEGESSEMVYATIKGQYSVLVNTPQGEFELNTIDGLDLIGEIGAILGESHTASIRANSEAEVIGIENQLFLSTITSNAQSSLKIMQLLAYRVKHLSIISAELTQKDS
ncbi:MAG: cyclic nucleotide-binding domain-containing protein [Granulosicoccus sp.]|nr:cyclic nucleotide-binding domain-containing protein [Granulosicoccus sp.]